MEPQEASSPKIVKPEDKLRLSEHYHKIRLTSLVLSIGLLMASLYGLGGVLGKLGLPGPETPSSANAPFLLFSLALAATVTFIHLWVIWRGEIVEIDAQWEDGKNFRDRIRDIIDALEPSIPDMRGVGERVFDLATNIGKASPIPEFNPERLRPAVASALKGPMLKLLEPEIEQSIGNARGQTSAAFMVNPSAQLEKWAEPPGALYLLLSSVYQSGSGSMPPDPMDLQPADFVPLNQALAEFVSGRDNEILHKVWQSLGVLEMDLRAALERGSPAVSSDIEAQLMSTVSSTLQQANGPFNERIAELERTTAGALVDQSVLVRELIARLDRTRQQLATASRLARAQLRGFDFWVPAALYVIALSHALGVLFGGFIPAAPEWFSAFHGLVLKVVAYI